MQSNAPPVTDTPSRSVSPVSHRQERVFSLIAFLLVLLAGAYFRFTGLTWGDYEYQHPDERFLIWVVADIAPVDNLSEYFNTRTSTLNPANRGHEFYVYGDFPVIATRYLAEGLFEQVGWEEILETGRSLSAFFDLLTTLLVFLTAERLFGWRVGMLAGLFSAASVLNIQQAHFFTTDSFATTFTMLAVYLAVILTGGRYILRNSLLFGLAVGLAMASKLNTFPVAVLLPLALLLAWLRIPRAQRMPAARSLLITAVAAGVVAFLTFRIAQPYAFTGPGFTGVLPDPAWMKSIQDQRAQAAGDVDFPPALQWARRPIWFSFQNLVLWGLGAPLGLLGFAGLLWFAYRAVRLSALRRFRFLSAPPWAGVLVVWLWTAFYFIWQSSAWNPTMRYQLPIYPTLALLAGWFIYDLWHQPRRHMPGIRISSPRKWRVGAGVLAGMVLLLTLAYAFAFTRIYVRPETRVAASRWILENVPGPINLEMERDDDRFRQMLPVGNRHWIRSGSPYLSYFYSNQPGAPEKLVLMSGQAATNGVPVILRARILDPQAGGQELAAGEVRLDGGGFERVEAPLQGPSGAWPRLEAGRLYTLALDLGLEDQYVPGSVELNGQIQLSMYSQASEIEYIGEPLSELTLETDGTLREIRLPAAGTSARTAALQAGISVQALNLLFQDMVTGQQQTAVANAVLDPTTGLLTNRLRVEPPLVLKAGTPYLTSLTPAFPGESLDPSQPVLLELLDDPYTQLMPAVTPLARQDDPLDVQFAPFTSGTLREITLAHAVQVDPQAQPVPLVLSISTLDDPASVMVEARVDETQPASIDPRGEAQTIAIDPPVYLEQGKTYNLAIRPEGEGAVAVRGSAPANESTWDMGLPFRMDGYDPYGGIYQGDLNFEMYWDDNEDKYQRFANILDRADYIFISSNRQWGTTTRLPERHPLTTAYYRALLGCPDTRDVIWCYNVAEEDTFEGSLGFELVKVFTSYPGLGPIQFNTQFAEEAFTVYDHPKVFIFKKSTAYRPEQVRAVLDSVDLTKVVHLSPKKAADYKDMLLSSWRWAMQQAGGTWADIFPTEGLQNRYPWFGAVLWYAALLLLGWFVYPLVRMALPGLPDRGYPLARIAGLLLLAYPLFLTGASGIPVTRLAVGIVYIGLGMIGFILFVFQRQDLRQNWKVERAHIIRVELIALALFALGLIIRLGNPDLWHPIFGGEKPMDLSYFNAVVKSTVFPPYDPWFAGGSLNYYYYGFILVGMPLKLVGIATQVGYNLILPALMMMVGLAAFSIVWNILKGSAVSDQSRSGDALVSGPGMGSGAVDALTPEAPDTESLDPSSRNTVSVKPAASASFRPCRWGLAAILALLLLGNLGTVRMFWQGWQKLVVPEEQMQQGSLVEHISWAGQGLGRWVSSGFEPLPYYTGDWYWKPSRAIQPEAGNEITEFPFFTFLYADLHAHMIALPVTLFLIAWAVAAVFRGSTIEIENRRLRGLSLGLALLLGALAAGALRPTNTWDQYTYLPFAAIALAYSQMRARPGDDRPLKQRVLRGILLALVLVGLSLLLYRPFDIWFGQGYNAIDLWEGNQTGISSFLVHWGLFLFVIIAWVFDETVDWMAHTPLSALNHLRGYRGPLLLAGIVVLAALFVLLASGVAIAIIAVPLGLWVTVLLFRPGQTDGRRLVLFMIGTALMLILAVELVVVRGDIGRMNTVFKFYYQAWSLLSLSAAAALGWLWTRLSSWKPGWRIAWQVGLGLLVFGAVLYPFFATNAKWNDRMVAGAPRTLDGMEYMRVATYQDGYSDETYREMDLGQDYRAIRWMQANVPGSPVIVEANTPEYRHWGTRYTIYTGLPGVVGWNWHQRQQRAITPDTWVTSRIEAVHDFYLTTSVEQAEQFLRRYNVQYIILGQLERIWYSGPGLAKFTAGEGSLWDKVYEEGETVIYRVR